MSHRTALIMIALAALAGCSATAPVAEAPAPAVDALEYRLGTGDRVRVTVFGHENLSGEFELDGDGQISLPLIQKVAATGLTTDELEQRVTGKLQPDYLKNPRVSIEVLNYRPFYIIGEVRQPGSYAYVSNLTIVTAVALAGGYTYRASPGKITVIRATDPGKTKQRVAEDTPVLPGDIIEVPERLF